MILSDFVNGIEESVTLAAAAKAKELKAAGHDVLILTVENLIFQRQQILILLLKKRLIPVKQVFIHLPLVCQN